MSIHVVPSFQVVARLARRALELPHEEGADALESGVREYVRSLLSKLHPSMIEFGERSAVTQLGDPDPQELLSALNEVQDRSPKTLVEDVLGRCARRLPRPDLDSRVYLLPGDGESRVLVQQMRGVLGFSLGAQATMVFLWPVAGWERWLQYTIAHEYAHLVRNLFFPRGISGGRLVYMKTGEPETLLDAMVAEGLADSFAREAMADDPDQAAEGEVTPPWTVPLSPEQRRRMWPRVRRRLGVSEPTEIRRMLFGDNDRVPLWTGYRFGFEVVSQYLRKNPNASPESVMGHTASSIFEATGLDQG